MAKGKRATETREQMLARMSALRAKRKLRQTQVAEGQEEVKIPQGDELSSAPPPNLFSGEQKHLEVIGKNGSLTDPIPGFRLYWFTDGDGTGIRIAMAQRSGYTHVTKDEVFCNDSLMGGTDNVGDKVRKIANIHSGAAGEKPIYAWLMKKPKWLHDLHENEREEKVHRVQERQIMAGRKSSRPEDKQYAPGEMPGSKLPRIEMDPKLYR